MPLSQERTRLLNRLRTRKSRVREQLVLVEGARACDEALAAGLDVRFALTSARLGATTAGLLLTETIADAQVDVAEVDDRELDDVSDTQHHQGILLVVAQPVVPLDSVAQGPKCLVLDGIQDPGNVGTLVRAARAFALDGVIALDGTVDVWGAKAVRASAGAAFTMPMAHAKWDDAKEALTAAGLPLLVADGAGQSVRGWRDRERFALVVGNEGAGVRPEVREHAAGVLSVPMPGTTESLNVGMAGSVLLFELTQEYGS
jgi:RNA methyltransferase, TrmH family